MVIKTRGRNKDTKNWGFYPLDPNNQGEKDGMVSNVKTKVKSGNQEIISKDCQLPVYVMVGLAGQNGN